jgi:urea-proton symporter
MIILIPLPLFFASTIYDVGSLKAWVIVAMIWAFLASFTVSVDALQWWSSV